MGTKPVLEDDDDELMTRDDRLSIRIVSVTTTSVSQTLTPICRLSSSPPADIPSSSSSSAAAVFHLLMAPSPAAASQGPDTKRLIIFCVSWHRHQSNTHRQMMMIRFSSALAPL